MLYRPLRIDCGGMLYGSPNGVSPSLAIGVDIDHNASVTRALSSANDVLQTSYVTLLYLLDNF